MIRFSRRLSWEAEPNRLTRLLEQKRARGERILDLTESNPTRALLGYPERGVLASFRRRENLRYEPTPLGASSARAAVARYYADRGLGVQPDELLLTASTSEAYSFLFKILADPGERILVPRPSYPLFDDLAALESLAVDSYPLVYEGEWRIDLQSLRQALRPDTRAILVVHPNNPTGSFLKQDEKATLSELCLEHDVALIVDEVFHDYVLVDHPERAPSWVASSPTHLTFVLSGLSKVAGLPQMKLAWIWAGGPGRDRALSHLEHVSDVFLSVGTPVQHGASRLLSLAPSVQQAIGARLASNLRLLGESLARGSCDLLHVEGGWYAVLRVPALRSSEDWACELLAHEDVYLHPGYFFDFATEAFLVVSLLTPEHVFREGVDRLVAGVEGKTE